MADNKPPPIRQTRNSKTKPPKHPAIPKEVIGQFMRTRIIPPGLPRHLLDFWDEGFKELKKIEREKKADWFVRQSLQSYLVKFLVPLSSWYRDEMDQFKEAYKDWNEKPDMRKLESRLERWRDKDFDYHSWVLYKPPGFYLRMGNIEMTDFDRFIAKKTTPYEKMVKKNLGNSPKKPRLPLSVAINTIGTKILKLE